MRRDRRVRPVLAAALLIFVAPVYSQAASPSNFSGTWTSHDSKNSGDVVLTIKQTDDAIEITREWQGKSAVSSFPLNGAAGISRTLTGVTGSGSAKWKGNDLVVDDLVTAPPIDGKSIRFHRKQTWQISKDGAILKIHVDVDSPDMPQGVTAVAIHPYTETYRRAGP